MTNWKLQLVDANTTILVETYFNKTKEEAEKIGFELKKQSEILNLIHEAVENECKNRSNPSLLAIGINEILKQTK